MKVAQGAERSNFLPDPRETPERWEKQIELERSLEQVRRDLQDKEEVQWDRRSLQGTGEQKRRLQSPAEDQGLYKEERSNFPGEEDNLPHSTPEEQEPGNILPGNQKREANMQGESSQPWTRSRSDPEAWNTESLPSGSWNGDQFSCDDFKLIFYKFLCNSSLRFLSHTPLRARRRRTSDELGGLH
ncbi:hypothetical protein XELAEV_18047747mg [Xenopus laevis]|nr:hypothetical protein XELAEV_18047747mg [Xenopus laevis]